MGPKSLDELGLSKLSAETLYDFYQLTYRCHRTDDTLWSITHCNQVLTHVMGNQQFSWRVVGITREALQIFKDNNFKRKTRSGITRAHRIPRIATVETVIKCEKPLTIEEFFSVWIAGDETVFCASGQNKKEIPDFIPFPEEARFLFRTNRVAWHHGREERAFLEELARKDLK